MTEISNDRGPLLPKDQTDPSSYGDDEIDWGSAFDGDSSYFRRADGRVAAPAGHCPELRINGDLEQGIEGLNDRQKTFLYFMANSSPNKGRQGPEDPNYVQFKDQMSAAEFKHFSNNSIGVAGCSSLTSLPKAWQDWLLYRNFFAGQSEGLYLDIGTNDASAAT